MTTRSEPDPLWRRIGDVAYVLALAVADLVWRPLYKRH